MTNLTITAKILAVAIMFIINMAVAAAATLDATQYEDTVQPAVAKKDSATASSEVFGNAATTAVIDALRANVDQHNYAVAYNLAKAHETELSGEPEFDYLFGIAATNSGKSAEAIFPLERVLIADAKNHRARLDLALAQYIMGDLVAAQQNFELVKQDNPPENVKNNIDIILARIEAQASKESLVVAKNVSMTIGYDSNINTINAATSIVTPTLTLTLDDDDRKRSDHFSTFDAGIRSNYPLDKMRNIFASVNLKEHMHARYRRYDQALASFELGPEIRNEYGAFRFPLQADYIYVDRNAFQHAWRIGTDWTRKIGQVTENVMFGSISRNRFSSQIDQDNASILLGTGITRDFRPWPVVGVVNLVYKKDNPHREGGEHNGKVVWSTEAKGIYLHNANNMGFVSFSLSRDRYEEMQPVFGTYRRDNSARFAAGWRRQIAKGLFFTPQGFYLKNKSNIQIYDYSRVQIGFNVGCFW